jgi:cell division protein FtsZ
LCPYSTAAIVPVAGNEELMAMSEFIKNLDVTFEIVSPLKDIDFTLLLKGSRSERVEQPKAIEKRNRPLFFDLPLF